MKKVNVALLRYFSDIKHPLNNNNEEKQKILSFTIFK